VEGPDRVRQRDPQAAQGFGAGGVRRHPSRDQVSDLLVEEGLQLGVGIGPGVVGPPDLEPEEPAHAGPDLVRPHRWAVAPAVLAERIAVRAATELRSDSISALRWARPAAVTL